MQEKRLIYILFIVLIAFSLVPHAYAQDLYSWQVNYQHVQLDVDSSGSVYMTYEVDANIQQGVWNEVWIPMTASNLQVSDVVDGNGKQHSFSIDTGDMQVKTQGWDLRPGDHVYLRINSTLPGFVYKADKPGYDIVTFVPPWWDMYITDTRVKFYLPGDVPKDQVFTGQKLYDNFGVENNRTWVYFENKNLAPNEQFQVAVSFPDTYMAPGAVVAKATEAPYIPPASGVGGLLDSLLSCSCPGIFMLFIFIIIIGSIAGSFMRQPYSSPVVSMDGIGVNKNLDPVEAATLLKVDPRRVLTMVMFGMMKKGNIKLISTDPIMVEKVSSKDLNYYEKLFANAIDRHILLEHKLLECFKVLARRVVDKTRPYCRKDTEDYYRSKIDEAWAEIKAVDTPELKLEKYDTDMFWLMADEQFTKKTADYVARTPGSDTIYVPSHYWWYPYYFGLPHYYGTGTPQPAPAGAPTTAQPGKAPPQAPTNQTTASVESFANSISNSVESMSAGVVTGVEQFLGVRNEANAPPPAKSNIPASYHSGGGSSCACVSCACACAHCACACACAGGGHGCT
jgi:hypothetical protein